MFGGAKGKGKGKKGTKSSPEKGQGHLLPKTRLSVEKFTGTVVTWKGKFGFIEPGEEIDHEKASLHGGKLFFGVSDLVDCEAAEEGSTVEFHINEDESGLGAEEVVVVSPGAGAPASAPKGKGKAAGAGKGGYGAAGAAKGGPAAKGAGKPWGAPQAEPPWGAAAKGGGYGGKGGPKGWEKGAGKPAFSGFEKGAPAKGKGKDGGKDGGKDKGKGKGKGKRQPGHLLPRTRLSVEKFTGTVHSWKGKYGWIVPGEEIDHELASKNSGRLFVGHEDLIDTAELVAEQVVEFHIWEDSSGLGADEVVITG